MKSLWRLGDGGGRNEMKPMNIKKGLKRIWILGSVLWVTLLLTRASNLGFSFSGFLSLIVGLAIWWGIYWGISGFFSDENK